MFKLSLSKSEKMLDDLKYIHTKDKTDALGVAEKQWQQIVHNFKFNLSSLNVTNIVLAGMGGSALPGVYIKSWPTPDLPFEISRDYSLPAYVNEKSLVIISSYSGNTEETLAALGDAVSRSARIVIVTAGGKLAEIAKEKNYPLIILPSGIQPRMCAFYFIRALLEILVAAKAVNNNPLSELEAAANWLKEETGNWRSEIPTRLNPAKSLALELVGKSVVVYSGPKLFPAANKFKIGLNENAKNIAWVNQYSEFNHNEFIGWSSHPIEKPYAVVEIRSKLENPQVYKRFDISDRLLSGKRPHPEIIQPIGDSLIKQLLWASVFCDFVSIYTAILNGVDPTPVGLVEKLKLELQGS